MFEVGDGSELGGSELALTYFSAIRAAREGVPLEGERRLGIGDGEREAGIVV